MNFHEYQAKQLFAEYGIAVPAGRVARTPEEAVDAAKAIGGDFWVVKAQIHAGGRGKAGGVKLAKTFDEVREYAKGMLGTKMETYQSAGVALPVDCVLVTQATDIAKELYLSVLVDRRSKAITFIASAEGGVEIEKTAEENPDAIKTLHVNYVQGLQPYQCREMGFALGLNAKQVEPADARSCWACTSCSTRRTWRWSNSTRWRSSPTATSPCSTARSIPTTTRPSAIRNWPRCATSARKTRPRCWPASTTSTTSRWTATSAAWSTAPAWRWRRWT